MAAGRFFVNESGEEPPGGHCYDCTIGAAYDSAYNDVSEIMLAYEYPADGQQCSPYQYPRDVGPVGMRLVVAEQYG